MSERQDRRDTKWTDRLSLQAKIVVANIIGSIYMLVMVLGVIYFFGRPALDASVLVELYRKLIPIFILSGVGGLLSGYLVVRKLIREPLTRVVSVTERVAVGDLSGSVVLASKDELGNLAEAFNTMTLHLSHLIMTVKEAAKAVSKGAFRLNENLAALGNDMKKAGVELEALARAVENQGVILEELEEKLHGILGLAGGSSDQAALVETCLTALGRVRAELEHLREASQRVTLCQQGGQYAINELLPDVRKLGHKATNLETLVDQFKLKEYARPRENVPPEPGDRALRLQKGA